MGARNGVINASQRQRLAHIGTGDGWPRAWAAIHNCRISAFVAFDSEQDEGIEAWIQERTLLSVARSIYDVFFRTEELLQKEYMDPRDALDSNATTFIELFLSSWFALARDEPDAWQRWGER